MLWRRAAWRRSDATEGGEVRWPDVADKRMVGDAWSECAKGGGMAVRPRKGDAVLFYHIMVGAWLGGWGGCLAGWVAGWVPWRPGAGDGLGMKRGEGTRCLKGGWHRGKGAGVWQTRCRTVSLRVKGGWVLAGLGA